MSRRSLTDIKKSSTKYSKEKEVAKYTKGKLGGIGRKQVVYTIREKQHLPDVIATIYTRISKDSDKFDESRGCGEMLIG